VRLNRSGARYLRRHRRALLAIRVTFTPDGGQLVRRRVTVRITR
jgi:hypothetical protein